MKKLPGVFKFLLRGGIPLRGTVSSFQFPVFVLPFLLLFFLSMNIVQAQEAVEIPGPEIKETGFVQVKELNIGDVVFVKNEGDKSGEGLLPVQITKLEYIQEPVEVYNLSVEGEETFFANDFAVHNKTPDRDPICFIWLSPRVSTAASRGYTETWSLNGIDGSLAKGNAFKNLFQYSGIGPNGSGFRKEQGNNICLYGQVINGCQYPAHNILPRYWDPDAEKYRCDYRVTPCCGCANACETNCGCTAGTCVSDCEMTCGPFRYGHTASDRLRFRQQGTICDGDGCGAALKVTAPAGYVIKSMTYSSQIDMCNEAGCHGSINLSRGMHWHLSDGMRPNAVFATLPTSGRHTVQMDRATKYFFISSSITSRETVNNWLVDNRAEIWDIKLELIKTSEIHETEVEVVNNSLIWYDPASHKVGEWDFRAVIVGTISFSNNNGQTWSSTQNIPDSNGNYSYPWTLDPNNPSVTVKVTSSTGDGVDYCSAGTIYTLPTGTITGNVYQNEWGACNNGQVLDGWTATCQHQLWSSPVAAIKISGTRFQCQYCPSGQPCTTNLPYGQYNIKVTPPLDYKQTSCSSWGSSGGDYIVSHNLQESSWSPGDLYLWQGAEAWFQIKEGDVHAQGGTISSKIFPLNTYFSDADTGDYPGLVSYYNSTDLPDFGRQGTKPSAKGWLAKDSLALSSGYDSFYSKLGSPTTAFDCDMSRNEFDGLGGGFYWVDGNCDMNQAQPLSVGGTKKLVIFVNGNLTFNSSFKSLNVDSGAFLAFIVKENINIKGTVGNKTTTPTAVLEGVYLADGVINTNSDGDVSGNRLVAEGIFYAQDGFSLGRNLKNDCIAIPNFCNEYTPAELFIARPDLFVNIPEELKTSYFFEQEVAP